MCDPVGSGSYDVFDEEIQYGNSSKKNLSQKSVQNKFVEDVPRKIEAIQNFIQKKQTNIKPFGEGSYEVAIEKERDGKTSASGTVGYETDNGTRIEGEARINSEGKASGKVSIGGKF